MGCPKHPQTRLVRMGAGRGVGFRCPLCMREHGRAVFGAARNRRTGKSSTERYHFTTNESWEAFAARRGFADPVRRVVSDLETVYRELVTFKPAGGSCRPAAE